MENIEFFGVKTNNLKNINVSIPLNAITVVTGVSGSGKSSLVFDTIYSESYRRYVESLSSFARQYLKAYPKPAVEKVLNLPPSVAVKQAKGSVANRRSTVGTITELYDLFRVVFTHRSEVYCRQCNEIIRKENGNSIAHFLLNKILKEQKVLVCSPLSKWQVDELRDGLKEQLISQGFTRCVTKGRVAKIEDINPNEVYKSLIIIDRIVNSEINKNRIIDSCNIALKLGRGIISLVFEDFKIKQFTSDMNCGQCNLTYSQPSLSLFSFNHPLGACATCNGFGMESRLDWEKILPDSHSSIAGRGIAPFNFGSHTKFYDVIQKGCEKRGIDPSRPFNEYSVDELNWLKFGDGKKNLGIMSYFLWLDEKRYKPHYRMHAAKFRKYEECSECNGKRLNGNALVCKINGKSIHEICKLNIEELKLWIEEVSNQSLIESCREAEEEIKSRIQYLVKIGVGYLSLERLTSTLSGGELQRINMAKCLGSALTDTLFCLDEPTSGLHVKDTLSLLEVIQEIQSLGNTVLLVEHDHAIIEKADFLIEIGPQAGHLGGEIVFAGSPLIKGYVTNEKLKNRRPEFTKFINLKDAKFHNLKNIEVQFPLSSMTVICGVSGSGKTTLIQHVLFPNVNTILNQKNSLNSLNFDRDSIENIKQHDNILLVSQAPLGKSSRSNIATYLGIYDYIRQTLAKEPLAKKLGLEAGAFSFNVSGGRCETCKGIGLVEEDLSFLGNVEITCPSCLGKRFTDEVLSVAHKNKNLIEILNLTVIQAREFFHDQAKITKILDYVVEIGLGYITLGQSTNSFSGGESQRLKLVSLLNDIKQEKPSILVFDEPSVGLSDFDVANLIVVLKKLTTLGHTVLIIEHHLHLIENSDWVIELGPGAGEKGGKVIFQGQPSNMINSKDSVTAPFLRRLMNE